MPVFTMGCRRCCSQALTYSRFSAFRRGVPISFQAGDVHSIGANAFNNDIRRKHSYRHPTPKTLYDGFKNSDNSSIYNSPPSGRFMHQSPAQADMTMKSDKPLHIPVMLEDVLEYLHPQERQVLVDMTFGAGGHSRAILERSPGAKLYVLDRDPAAHSLAQQMAQEYEGRVEPMLGQFSDLHALLSERGVAAGSVDGFLFDVGASSIQFDRQERGFSISRNGPLDMRMDGNRNSSLPSAADVVNLLDEKGLYTIIRKYGEEKMARKIAGAIIETRLTLGKITTTQQLAQVVESVFEMGEFRKDKLMRHSHVATKTFQALRIFVNDELNELNKGLHIALNYLRPGGRCVCIAFHSLEDRIIKRHFLGIDMDAKVNMTMGDHYRQSQKVHSAQEMEQVLAKKWEVITKKVVTSSDSFNPRSRSAKLRAAVKL